MCPSLSVAPTVLYPPLSACVCPLYLTLCPLSVLCLSVPLCLSLCPLSLCRSLSVSIFLCLSSSLYRSLSVRLTICLSVSVFYSLSVSLCLSVSHSVCVSLPVSFLLSFSLPTSAKSFCHAMQNASGESCPTHFDHTWAGVSPYLKRRWILSAYVGRPIFND